MFVNMNDMVSVQLTPRGQEIYRVWLRKSSSGGRVPLPDSDQEMSLWQLMRIFGSHSRVGAEAPFVDGDMKIVQSKLQRIRSMLLEFREAFEEGGDVKVGWHFLMGLSRSDMEPQERELICTFLLSGLSDWFDHLQMVLGLLKVVGTPTCNCPDELQWKVAYQKLTDDTVLDPVRYQAALALVRLSHLNPELGDRFYPDWRKRVARLIQDHPSAVELEGITELVS